MTEVSKVLLIEDDDAARAELNVILAFLGEELIRCTSENWLSIASHDLDDENQLAVVIIGNCRFVSLDQILNNLTAWEAGIPFVIIGQQALPKYLDEEVVSRVTANLPQPLRYQSLLDALHKAKVFREHYKRLEGFEGVKDFNMFRSLVGNSAAIQRVREMMGQVAHTEVSVLITGASGTGKEVVARNLHLNSARADKPFVPLNCGAIPRELLESELFGHEKGAFTGAIADRAGRFELAEGGTLFLDEIGDMPLNMQVKLLRVLQERSFERVGGVKTIQSDVRIFAATHKDLEKMIDEGEFRQDLYYRINVFPIEMPSLRERAEDIPLLLNELISTMEAEKRGSVRFNSSAIASLSRHPWPGNVRELANLIERMAILYPHGIVGLQDLPKKFRHLQDEEVNNLRSTGNSNSEIDSTPDQGSQHKADDRADSSALAPIGTSQKQAPADVGQSLLPLNGMDLKEYLANLEKDLISQALDDSAGVVARAADRLNIRRTTLVEKIRKYNLQKTAVEETE